MKLKNSLLFTLLASSVTPAFAQFQIFPGIRPGQGQGQASRCAITEARTTIQYGRDLVRAEYIDLLREFRIDAGCQGLKIEGIAITARARRGSTVMSLEANRMREGLSEILYPNERFQRVVFRTNNFRNEIGRDIRNLELVVDGTLRLETLELLVDTRSLQKETGYSDRRLVGRTEVIGATDLVNNSIREFVFRVRDDDGRGRIRGMGPLQGLELTARDDAFAINALEITFADGNRITLPAVTIGERRSLYVDFSEINEPNRGGHRGRRGHGGRGGGGRWNDSSDHVVEVRVRGSKGSLFGTRARLEINAVRY